MSDSVTPKEGPMWWQLVRSATVRWLQVTFARRPAGKKRVNKGVLGEA
jgi:hypothetical protein